MAWHVESIRTAAIAARAHQMRSIVTYAPSTAHFSSTCGSTWDQKWRRRKERAAMQSSSFLLPWPSSSDGGGGIFFPSRNSFSFVGLWAWAGGRGRRSADRAAPAAAGTGSLGGEQDHYAVLGLPRSASVADVKRAYRLLARKVSPYFPSSFVWSYLHSVAKNLIHIVRSFLYFWVYGAKFSLIDVHSRMLWFGYFCFFYIDMVAIARLVIIVRSDLLLYFLFNWIFLIFFFLRQKCIW